MADVRVSARNGRLVGMTAVARVLPRDWDGRRLLRFLTGLAMLALAFTVHMTPPAAASPDLSAPAASASAASASAASGPVASESAASAPVVAEEPVAALPAVPAETPAYRGFAIILLLVGGFALRVRAERAPPGA
jgi:hypothetical protein